MPIKEVISQSEPKYHPQFLNDAWYAFLKNEVFAVCLIYQIRDVQNMLFLVMVLSFVCVDALV